jgi:hypothetical protein
VPPESPGGVRVAGLDVGDGPDGFARNDVAARALYESAGFTNFDGGDEGARMLYYERDL